MLNYDEDPEKFQESFLLNFEVSHVDMFGSELKHELKENGRDILVTMENRQVCVCEEREEGKGEIEISLFFLQEFVDLYTDWLLNTSIHKKFKAFKQGFDLVMSQSCLADLVIAEELELIVCGSTVSLRAKLFLEPSHFFFVCVFLGMGH